MGQAILKTTVSDVLAANFLNTIVSNDIGIYLVVGRTDADPWDDEDNPTIPKDSLQDELEFRNKIIGIKRIAPQRIALIFRRMLWKENTEYFTLDPTINGPRRQTNWYVVTSENKVFQCIGTAGGGLTTTGSEPSLMGPSIVTPDGYTWKFLFDINPAQLTQSLFIGEDWLPVPYNINGEDGGTITSNQKSYGDVQANFTLGVFRILFSGVLEDEGTSIPYGISYRQIGLLVNPLGTDGTIFTGTNASSTGFDTTSGQLIYLENRAPVYRESDSQENLSIVISF